MGTPVAENTRRIIREKGLKQRYVAKESRLGEKALSAMLCGRKTITAEHVATLCKVLDVSANEIYRDVS